MYLFDLTFKQRPYTFLLPKKSSTGRSVQSVLTKHPELRIIEVQPSVVSRHASVVSETLVFQQMCRMEKRLMASPMEYTC